ncbi:MAG TPA: radical SAM protein, partial [bacterium]|nr:radical SAM protein [bacterium]
DHRFLTERGWKFVTGAEHGPNQRSFLTVNNKLMGVGAFVPSLQRDSLYMRGYLTGVIRGDGHQFGPAMKDTETLRRAERYLQESDGPAIPFLFSEGSAKHASVSAIRTSSRKLVDEVRHLVAWPSSPPSEWWRGLLAGIFDAEGSYSRGVLRISNTDPVIIDHIVRGLRVLGFDHVVEPASEGRARVVRVRGGLRAHMRFFHTVDPAIGRKRDIAGQAVKSDAPLRVVAIEPLRRTMDLVDITTGTGDFIANGVISHNCYARQTHWYLDQDGLNDWGSRIFVKVNAPEVLRRELSKRSWKREQVEIGTATDPYQPAEGAYKITRRILEALRDYQTPAGLITRSTMVVRDLDILQQLQRGPGAYVCVSVATLDALLAEELEPGAPPPLRRLEALQTLARAGIPTVVMLAPVLPGITDDVRNITDVIEAARRFGASSLATIELHLGDVARDAFFEYLTHRRPELVPEYERLYRGKYAPGAYRAQVQRIAAAIKARVGFGASMPSPESAPPVPKSPAQMPLFPGGTLWKSTSGSSSTSTRPTSRATGPAAGPCPPSKG